MWYFLKARIETTVETLNPVRPLSSADHNAEQQVEDDVGYDDGDVTPQVAQKVGKYGQVLETDDEGDVAAVGRRRGLSQGVAMGRVRRSNPPPRAAVGDGSVVNDGSVVEVVPDEQ